MKPKLPYSRILAAVACQPWAILPEKGEVIASFLTAKIQSESEAGPANSDQPEFAAAVPRKSKKPAGGVAVIPVYGTITQRADMMTEWSGGTSADTVSRLISDAVADPAVESVVLDFDSPGGSVYGVQELWQTIFDLKEKKKITSVVNPVAASAAYWIASASSEIVVTPSGEVGSIGVYLMHVDVSSAMTSAGRKVTLVKAGERKASGHPYAPLDPTALDELQSGVNDYYDKFVRAVAKGRKTTQTAVRDGFGRGGMVRAEAAVKEGMADSIGTLDLVLSRYGVSVSDIRSEEIKENTENQDIEIRKRKMKMMDIA